MRLTILLVALLLPGLCAVTVVSSVNLWVGAQYVDPVCTHLIQEHIRAALAAETAAEQGAPAAELQALRERRHAAIEAVRQHLKARATAEE